MNRLRVFVAIPILRIHSLEEWMNYLKSRDLSGRIKWNDARLWHLTLKFIGRITEEKLELIKSGLREALGYYPAGEIIIEDVEIFGSQHNPGVLGVRIRNTEWLKCLKEQVDKGLIALELSDENHSFRPHFTIGRPKLLKDPSLFWEEIDKKRGATWGVQEVNSVVLYNSRLTSDGPVYSVIERYKLVPGNVSNGA
jgi:2'-5' RNA ligase